MTLRMMMIVLLESFHFLSILFGYGDLCMGMEQVAMIRSDVWAQGHDVVLA